MSRCRSGWRRAFLRFGTRSPAGIRRSATIRSRIAPSVVIRVLTSMSLAAAVRVTARFELQDTSFNEHSEDLGKLGLIRLIRGRRRQICLGCIDRLTPAVAAELGPGSVLQPELGITVGDLDLSTRAGARPGLANLVRERSQLWRPFARGVTAFTPGDPVAERPTIDTGRFRGDVIEAAGLDVAQDRPLQFWRKRYRSDRSASPPLFGLQRCHLAHPPPDRMSQNNTELSKLRVIKLAHESERESSEVRAAGDSRCGHAVPTLRRAPSTSHRERSVGRGADRRALDRGVSDRS